MSAYESCKEEKWHNGRRTPYLGGRIQEMMVDFSCLRFASQAGVFKVGRSSGLEPKAGWVERLVLGRGTLSSPANGCIQCGKREPGIKSLQESSLGGGIQGCLSRAGFCGRGTLPWVSCLLPPYLCKPVMAFITGYLFRICVGSRA